MSTGPIEVLVLGFPRNQFSGEILPELANLVDSGQIAILDLEFVAKTVDGVQKIYILSSRKMLNQIFLIYLV